jgi:SAM-dependent methyltransferase
VSIGVHELLQRADSIEALLRSAAPDQVGILYYVLSTVRRGRMIAGYGADRLGPGKHFLDVGCGFGGSLVGAHELGATVHGIEIDSTRLAAARALMMDNGISAKLEACDIFTSCFELFPHMDLVVSENVIEHVDDPRRFMETMFAKLVDGGALILEIPNGRALRSVTSDPHYNLPSITLLSHESARRLFEVVLGRDQYGLAYSVGDYFPAAWYREALGARSARITRQHRADALYSLADLPDALTKLDAALERAKTLYDKLPALLREEVFHKARCYIDGVRAAHASLLEADADQSAEFDAFEETYLSAAWIMRFDRA